MKIAVIGATRGIGLEVVKQGLERGHEITALLRDPAKLVIQHADLRKLQGDARNAEDIRAVVEGQDAVCDCVGGKLMQAKVNLFSTGASHIIAALAQSPKTKYVTVTGIGAGDSRGHGGFLYDKIFQPLLLRMIYEDKDRQEALIRASSANWLIVRPGFLTMGPRTGKYRAITDLNGVTAGKISRADVAEFMLNQIEAPTFFKQTPLLTY